MSRRLMLFDVDGTLTMPRLPAQDSMMQFLQKIRGEVDVAYVGGSDKQKIDEQLGKDSETFFDYAFSQNGLVAYKAGQLVATNSIQRHFGDKTLNELISECLVYIAKLDIPVKRGTFVEFRSGMINVSPIGRNCSQEERLAFFEYDKKHHVREDMIKHLKQAFPRLDVQYSIGGQISFDMFPMGWDKTYCLQFLQDQYDQIHFFGDKTYQGGNDYEIFVSDRVHGHTVTSPEDTIVKVSQLLKSK